MDSELLEDKKAYINCCEACSGGIVISKQPNAYPN